MNNARFRIICPEVTYYFLDLQSAVSVHTDLGGILQYLKNNEWLDVEEA